MKKAICLIIHSLLSMVIMNGQQPWQKISYPAANEILANFKTPPSEYGMILWWGWDATSGKITSFKGFGFSLGPWETRFVIIKK